MLGVKKGDTWSLDYIPKYHLGSSDAWVVTALSRKPYRVLSSTQRKVVRVFNHEFSHAGLVRSNPILPGSTQAA